MPIISLSVYGLWVYAQHDWRRFMTLGLVTSRPQSNTYTTNKAAVHMYLWAFLLFYAVTSMHVQVIIRFFTSLPPLYWFVAHLWIKGFGAAAGTDRTVANVVLLYFVLYGLVGIVLFAGFLPPA
ncbi:hypothetical protein DFQ28_003636 [Apophysomyces sp. BC1034]|nr:hypothetical protein DFQ30_001840 [Apophysomyces sp. BC1015]KAG0182907.1 hypothetical protein DFQ29_001345 [Apophysomyces sp. BC1021]KAG0193716.1 hypothetical protein DFQ28_003636 [Apophysomyces sp. BC1034]